MVVGNGERVEGELVGELVMEGCSARREECSCAE